MLRRRAFASSAVKSAAAPTVPHEVSVSNRSADTVLPAHAFASTPVSFPKPRCARRTAASPSSSTAPERIVRSSSSENSGTCAPQSAVTPPFETRPYVYGTPRRPKSIRPQSGTPAVRARIARCGSGAASGMRTPSRTSVSAAICSM